MYQRIYLLRSTVDFRAKGSLVLTLLGKLIYEMEEVHDT